MGTAASFSACSGWNLTDSVANNPDTDRALGSGSEEQGEPQPPYHGFCTPEAVSQYPNGTLGHVAQTKGLLHCLWPLDLAALTKGAASLTPTKEASPIREAALLTLAIRPRCPDYRATLLMLAIRPHCPEWRAVLLTLSVRPQYPKEKGSPSNFDRPATPSQKRT